MSFTNAELSVNKFSPKFIAVQACLKILLNRHFSSTNARRQHMTVLKSERRRIEAAPQKRQSSSAGSAKNFTLVIGTSPKVVTTPTAASSPDQTFPVIALSPVKTLLKRMKAQTEEVVAGAEKETAIVISAGFKNAGDATTEKSEIDDALLVVLLRQVFYPRSPIFATPAEARSAEI